MVIQDVLLWVLVIMHCPVMAPGKVAQSVKCVTSGIPEFSIPSVGRQR